jgi:hypothetical protein
MRRKIDQNLGGQTGLSIICCPKIGLILEPGVFRAQKSLAYSGFGLGQGRRHYLWICPETWVAKLISIYSNKSG